MKQMKVDVVPTTFPKANRVIKKLHRHHAPLPGGFSWYCLAAISDYYVVGVAICGRPTNRNNDDGQTVEVLRLATDGTANAPSALLGAAGRVAKAMGARRCITYTLDEESGVSLKGAGWICEKSNIQSWWTHKGSRTAAIERDHHKKKKLRWAIHFRTEAVIFDGSLLLDDE